MERKKKSNKKKLPPGTICRFIFEAKDKFNVSPEIKVKTIESCFHRKWLCVNHPGIQTPMADVERYIVDVAQQKAMMNQPLASTDCLNTWRILLSWVQTRRRKYIISTRNRSILQVLKAVMKWKLVFSGKAATGVFWIVIEISYLQQKRKSLQR